MGKKYVYLFTEGNAGMRELLGGKGANLAEMTNLGLPVPQGFTISTEACTQYYEDGRRINDDIQAEIMENIEKIEKPRVAIVNIGDEEEKGNALVKETYPLLKECKDINFVGSIEAREIPNGAADVIVCEAFVGNVILKLYEGLAKMLLGEIKKAVMSSFKSKIGGALIKDSLGELKERFNAKTKGGAPLLGLKGLVVKIHGNSHNEEVKSAIFQCINFSETGVNAKIAEKLSEEQA